jgi:hypothetical protein
MLLVAAGRVENTGQEWNTAGTDVRTWGESPSLIEQVKGSVTLRGLQGARAVSLQAIDGAGQPAGEAVNAIRVGDGWTIPLGKTVTTWYEITVKR